VSKADVATRRRVIVLIWIPSSVFGIDLFSPAAPGGKRRPEKIYASFAPHSRTVENQAVAHLRLTEVDEATGLLKEEYDAAVGRAGKVFNIVKSMSLRPPVLRRSMELYKAIMFGQCGLSRQERELLATVVSRENDCHY
jgi:hypothetical protein